MTLKRWNWKKHEYEDFEVPDHRRVATYMGDLNASIDCASCGDSVPYGLSYTSMEIHTEMGIGYCICGACYDEEWKRRADNA